ncbi:hypothetical protein CHUAL_006968 [Chamberlinius hualienensis]
MIPSLRTGFVLLILTVIAGSVFSFNVDVDYPIPFEGPQSSFFGFSTALLNSSNRFWIIVGAPKANASSVGGSYQPGLIFKCPLDQLSNIAACTVLNLNPGDSGLKYIKDNSWLGVSVDATSFNKGSIVACQHLSMTDYRTRGACYTVDGNLNKPNIERFESGSYQDSFFGIAAQFVKNSDGVMVGSPQPYRYDPAAAMHLKTKKTTKRFNSTASFYLSNYGYAVTSGRFRPNHNTEYAIGNPNQPTYYYKPCYRGKVFITDNYNREINFGVELVGEQMGEYYGSSVCAIDLNNDQLDDLLVGAPLHSINSDEGKVYVYVNSNQGTFKKSNAIMGSAVAKARFGTSIANIGDINKDGYQDVAIGAPYEHDTGAVYIYHGNAQGLSSGYKQRITANKVKGFGISIASNLDIDGNNYSDMAIGAYHSDKVFLYRSRPVAKLKANLTTDIKQIDFDKKTCIDNNNHYSCFVIQPCFIYRGVSVPTSLAIQTFMDLDSTEQYYQNKRVKVQVPNSRPQSNFTNTFTISRRSTCYNYTILVENNPSMDYMSEIYFKLTYRIINDQTLFCSTCPVSDPKDRNETVASIGFKTDCGADQKCLTDLNANASFTNLLDGKNLKIGSMTHLGLHVDINNYGEAAYNLRMRIIMPSWMKVETQMCQYFLEDQYSSLHCILDNPLYPNRTRSLDLAINLQDIPYNFSTYVINVTVDSNSEEHDDRKADNIFLLKLPVTAESDITVNGGVSEDQFVYYEEKEDKYDVSSITFTHKYEVVNYGPSSIRQISLEILHPTRLLTDNEFQIIKVTDVVIPKDSSGSLIIGVCNGSTLQDSVPKDTVTPETPEILNYRKRRELSANEVSDNKTHASDTQEYFKLDCTNSICKTIACTIGPFHRDSRVTVAVTFQLDTKNLKQIVATSGNALIESEANVIINDYNFNIQPDVHLPDKAKSYTTIKLTSVKKLASWIIPTSCCLGISLVLIIVAVLIKFGFFQRKKMDEMKALINQLNDKKNVETKDTIICKEDDIML